MNQKDVSEYRNLRLTPYQGLIRKNWGYLSRFQIVASCTLNQQPPKIST